MSRAYLQYSERYLDAIGGTAHIFLGDGTTYANVYDPISGAPISNPVSIGADGYVQAYHVDNGTVYNIVIRNFAGEQKFKREMVQVPADSTATDGADGKSVRVQAVSGGAQVYDEFGNTVIVLDGAAGPAGPAGATGATGPAGATGATGANGADGKDGYLQLPALPDPSTVDIGQPVILPDGTMWTNVTGNWTTLTVGQAELDKKQIVFTGICQHQYLTEADCEVDCTGAVPVFRINTVRGGTAINGENPICFYTDGDGTAIRHTIDTPISVEFTYTSGLWYFHFNSAGTLIATQDVSEWSDFSRIAVVWRAYINADRSGQDRYETESVEYHTNTISWNAHEWMHALGTIHISGLDSVSNVLSHTAGVPTIAPASDGRNTCISISSGATSDDGLKISITNSTDVLPWNQDLGVLSSVSLNSSNSAQMQMTYNNNAGLLFMAPATRFPFSWNTSTNRPEYINAIGERIEIADNNWMVNFVYSLQDSRNGKQVRLRSATQAFTSFASAQAYNWDSLQANSLTIRDKEIRPLYKLTHYVNPTPPNAYDAACKFAGLVEISDIRKSQVQNSTLQSGTVPATNVSVSPISGLTSLNAQSALQELQSDKLDKVETDAQTVAGPVTFNSASIAITTERPTASTNTITRSISIGTVCLGNMADGFSSSIRHTIKDDAGVTNEIALENAVRDGADNSSKFQIQVFNAGVAVTSLEINKNGTTKQLNNPASTSNDTSHATTKFVNENRSYGKDTAFPFKTATPTYLAVCDVTLPANGEFYVGFKIMLYDLGASPIILEYYGASKQGVTGSAKLRTLGGIGPTSSPIGSTNFRVAELEDQGDGRIRIGLYAGQSYAFANCKARIFDKVFHPGLVVDWSPDGYINALPYAARDSTFPS